MTVASLATDRREALTRVFGDAAAFRRWYDDAVIRVYRYLYGRCGGDADLAEELTQQTFIQAIRHWSSYDGRADSVTWLCSIARNRLIDHYREIDRQQRRHLRLVVHEIPVADPGTPARVDDREAVLAALHDLPAIQRAALVLRYVDGLSVREVSLAIGRSEAATESIIRRAKDGFRAHYPGAFDD